MPRIMAHAMRMATRADEGAEHGGRVRLLTGGAGGRPNEQGGFETLTAHGERGEQDDRPGAGLRGIQLILELGREHTGVFCHPENHPGDEADRDDGKGTADGFLRLEGEGFGAEGE